MSRQRRRDVQFSQLARAFAIQVTLGAGATGRNLLALQVLELGDLLRRQLLGQVPAK